MKKRWYKKREADLKGTGYDSYFEKNIHEQHLQNSRFHDKKDHVPYVVEHHYEPDFVLERDGKTFYIETKGRFRDSAEARKYTFIRKVLPSTSELVFIWEKARTAFPFAKKRKDGTKMTHIEWAEKNGFRSWDQSEFDVTKL